MNAVMKYARQASLWKWEIKVQGSLEHMQKARLLLLPQLLCTLCSILLTSHISIRFQHTLPSPAMNQNLEGSDLAAKEPFDKLVTDARQLWVGRVLLQNTIANLCRHPKKKKKSCRITGHHSSKGAEAQLHLLQQQRSRDRRTSQQQPDRCE